MNATTRPQSLPRLLRRRVPAAWVIRALTLGLLAFTLPLAARGLYGPPGAWVHIRWQPSVGAAERQRLETAWQLVDGQEDDSPATWRYDLTAPSVGRLRAIVEHAAVEDTHFIDRQRYTIEPGALRTVRRHGLIAVGGTVAVGLVDRLATFLAVLAGLCVLVRHRMRVVRRLQPYIETARGVAADVWPFRSNTVRAVWTDAAAMLPPSVLLLIPLNAVIAGTVEELLYHPSLARAFALAGFALWAVGFVVVRRLGPRVLARLWLTLP